MTQHYIHLDHSEPRCVPSRRCNQAPHCAHALVSQAGRALADFSISLAVWTPDHCVRYLPASEHRAPPAIERAVRDAVKGLS